MEIFDIHHHLGSLSGGSLQEGDDWQERGLCQPSADYGSQRRISVGDSCGDGLYSGRRHQRHHAL